MFAKVVAACVSPFLLIVLLSLLSLDDFSNAYPALGSSLGILFFIVFLANLFFAIPFTLVIDVFVLRLESLSRPLKHVLRVALFIGSAAVMALYISFLLDLTVSGGLSRTLILFVAGAAFFLLAESLVHLIARKLNKSIKK